MKDAVIRSLKLFVNKDDGDNDIEDDHTSATSKVEALPSGEKQIDRHGGDSKDHDKSP